MHCARHKLGAHWWQPCSTAAPPKQRKPRPIAGAEPRPRRRAANASNQATKATEAALQCWQRGNA
eukprot:9896513-Alexandrium_andersonii.AAC.1